MSRLNFQTVTEHILLTLKMVWGHLLGSKESNHNFLTTESAIHTCGLQLHHQRGGSWEELGAPGSVPDLVAFNSHVTSLSSVVLESQKILGASGSGWLWLMPVDMGQLGLAGISYHPGSL